MHQFSPTQETEYSFIAIDNNDIKKRPPAKPSNPSIKLKAFVRLITAKMVKAININST